MKVILVDDEPAMHLILRKMLGKIPEVEVAGVFTEPAAAAAYLREHADIGLAFVDISMPGEDGVAFAARAEEENFAARIVFVTSHKDFALRAYELSVLDYLVKPVSQERLERTVNRVLAERKAPAAAPRADRNPAETVVTALGDVFVRNEAGRVKWISRKSAELFAYLLLHRGKRIPRSRLLTEIFGGMSQGNAENYLNTTVYQLRKSLQPLGLREAVRSENDGYALELEHAVIDYEAFVERAQQLERIDAGNAEEALRAEQLYTGDLFGDKAYVWAIHETERVAGLYASLVLRLSAALLEAADSAGAAKLLHKLLERNPLDESAVRLLMRAHASAGDKKALTARYTDYVRLLGRELGIRPPRELVFEYDALVSGMGDKKRTSGDRT
ncbi:response regulator [Paenibacillus glycinis]|uniref:Response regulator n=1 Tax=Paenibacillus glycinis TaxID=2697035 RepID=A0ABW9XXV9_9BACL|nr:response regulator [Paenibacillus glycinis]NBD27469.1 response regulator [Paenibacillus glycinis]